MTPHIRVLTSADLPAITAFEGEVFSASDQWSEAIWAAEMQPNRVYFGAFVDGQLIGMAGAFINEVADLLTIGILPDWRGRSVASTLLDLVIDTLKKAEILGPSEIRLPGLREVEPRGSASGQIVPAVRKVQKMLLEVRASNLPAISLYASRGFKEIARIPRYYHQPEEDAVIMELLF